MADGRTVTLVARDWDVARQTVHVWLRLTDWKVCLAAHIGRPLPASNAARVDKPWM
jgi:hypothetical protein